MKHHRATCRIAHCRRGYRLRAATLGRGPALRASIVLFLRVPTRTFKTVAPTLGIMRMDALRPRNFAPGFRWLWAFVLIATLSQHARAAETNENASRPSISFGRDILPILSDKCFQCHGPDAKARKGKLRLDTEAG